MAIETILASDLKLGDVIQLFEDAYSYATVRRINDDGSVQVFRPFVHAADFSYTGGVAVYVGHEDFALWPGTMVKRVRKGDPLK